MNISNEHDKEIIRSTESGNSKSVFEVVQLHGEDFSEVNVATAFHELAKIGSNKGADEKKAIQDNPTFQSMIGGLPTGHCHRHFCLHVD